MSMPNKKTGFQKLKSSLVAILFWLLVWQGLSMWVDSPVLLVSPLQTAKCLISLVFTADFWKTVGNTALRIMAGFIFSTVGGILLGVLSYRRKAVQMLISPAFSAMKAIPVASITILILLWVPSRNLSVAVTTLIGLPIMYSTTLEGMGSVNIQLLEMAECYHVSFHRQWMQIYLPHLIPFLQGSIASVVGLCWKSGVAAEVIGIPNGTVGEKLYRAKVYLETPELFSWTITVVLLSVFFEKIIRKLIFGRIAGKSHD